MAILPFLNHKIKPVICKLKLVFDKVVSLHIMKAMQNFPTLSTWQDALLEAGTNLLTSLALFIPNLLGAIIVFFLGLLLGGWAKTIVVKLLSVLKLSKLFEGTGVSKFLTKAEVTAKVESVIGEAVRLLIVLIFFVASVNLLGLTTVTIVLNSILAYIPNVLAAILIITLGVLIAGVVEGLVKGSLGAIDIKTSRLLAKISSYVIVTFSVLAALSQLRIAQQFVNTLFTGFIAMLALGLGLSLGLGSKDLINQLLTDWYKNFKKDIK